MKYLYRISLTFMILTILSACLLGGFYFYQKWTLDSDDHAFNEPAEETAVEAAKTDCDTEYVILVQNLNSGKSESLVEEIPAKYMGKTKEELISLLSQEEKAPSLRDRQKGIQSIRLSAFSRERVVVVKTYEIRESEDGDLQKEKNDKGETAADEEREGEETEEEIEETMQSPVKELPKEDAEENSGNYYLMACDGMVCVYQEDMKTVYLVTGIMLDQLPDEVRQEILDKKYIKNEEELYNFLESYSS